MLKAITYFEQVPLGQVMEIVARDEHKEGSAESCGETELDLLSFPAKIIATNGAKLD
jgi:hypothetical protein